MKDQKLIDWLNSLADKTPTPGGGAVAGLNGAIAAAQLKMVCGYTKDKLHGLVDLDNKIQTFLELSQADSQAYLDIKQAYKSKNQTNIQSALFLATKPSQEITLNCQDIYNFCQANLALFNKNLLSDLVVCLANLAVCVESAQAMLQVNSSAMQASQSKNQTIEQIKFCEQLIEKINSLKSQVKTGDI